MTFKLWIKNIILSIIILPISIIVFIPFIIFGILYYLALIILSIVYPPLSTHLKTHAFNQSIGIDQLANASILGNVDQTMSGRFGYAINYKDKRYKILVIICKILSFLFRQDNHCLEAIEFDRLD